jgi:sarcosine oxidase subunit gamma
MILWRHFSPEDGRLTDSAMTAQSGFAGILVSPVGPGLVATERDGLGIASLSARRGQRAALQDRAAAQLGIALPEDSRRVTAGAIAAAATGPGTWLLTHEDGGNAFIGTLRSVVGNTGSIVDLCDAYAVLRLRGTEVRAKLATLVPLDLHPRAFRVGQVAATLAAQVGALLWRIDDDADGQPIFEIAVARSMAASFWHAMSLGAHSP